MSESELEEEFRVLEDSVDRRDHPEKWLLKRGIRGQDLAGMFLRHHQDISPMSAVDILRMAIEWAYPPSA